MQQSFFGCPYTAARDGNISNQDYQEQLRRIFEVLKPKPSPYPLVRIGGAQDGAYLLPDDFAGITDCFSPGVNNRKPFEDELADRFSIRSHMCDFTSEANQLATPLVPGLQSFRKCWLDVDGKENSIRLEDWVAELAPSNAGDLLLQIDIEGAEYRNLLACPVETLKRFRMIVIELHSLHKLLDQAIFQEVLFPFFDKLGQLFFSVHAHPNNYGGEFVLPGIGANIPDVLELTFIRKDRLANPKKLPLNAPLLPHPLDFLNNKEAAPVVLNQYWLDGFRPILSELRIELDELAFENAKTRVAFDNNLALTRRLSRTGYARLVPDSVSTKHDTAEIDVAAGRRYWTGLLGGYPDPAGTIPGDMDRNTPAGNFFFHTSIGANPFITVDLENTRKIRKISIGNRLDGCFDRANLLYLILHETESFERGEVFLLEPSKEFLEGKGPLVNVLSSAVEARYVTVTSPRITALHFSSLKIFAGR